MRKTTISMALEAIEFQDGQLYRDLIVAIEDLYKDRRLSGKAFWQGEGIANLSAVIKARTNITIWFNDAGMDGPYVFCPMMDNNHPFMANWIKQLLINGYRFDTEADIQKIMKTMGTDLVKGSVDLKRSRVDGVFADFQMEMFMPRNVMDNNNDWTAEETAAVILHELGHCFTYMEYAGRVMTTNQVLAGLLRVNDGTVDATARQTVFAKGRELLRMNKEQQEALLNAKGSAEITAIVLDSAIELSRSQLGFNIYDGTSCEQSADQFATRHGAGRALVTALDKLGGAGLFGSWSQLVTNVWSLLMWVVALVFCPPLVLLLALFMTMTILGDHYIPEHNTDLARMTRVKNEINTRLKNPTLGTEEKRALLRDVETIQKLAKTYTDSLDWMQAIAYVVRPGYRQGRKFQVLQNQLEALGASDLYAKAAKLSTL